MTDTYDKAAARFLDSLRRPDLVALLSRADIELEVFNGKFLTIVNAPEPFAEAFRKLPPMDAKRIAEGTTSVHSGRESLDNIEVRRRGLPLTGWDALLPDLIIHREMMIDVSTGKQEIKEVEDYYGARQARIVELCAAAGIPYENPHDGLWDWYHYWKDKNLSRWAERRDYVRKLFINPIAMASGRINKPGPIQEREPTGWRRVDRALAKARAQFSIASSEEDWQQIGLLCREVLISLAQAVYDPEIHTTVTEDGKPISTTDGNRMIEAYVGQAFPGSSYQEVRVHAWASLALALNLQHRRTATRQLAALCIEATSSAVAVISIIANGKK